jgi:hypothetical protein
MFTLAGAALGDARKFVRARVRMIAGVLVLLGAGASVAQTDAVVAEARASDTNQPALVQRPQTVGHLAEAQLREVSGLAASARHAGRYWVHNDSGSAPLLYAINEHGALVGTLQIDGVLAVDWEDIASFKRDGKPYLLVADSGDNLGLRGEYALIEVEEPELPADGAIAHASPVRQLRYRYADAPHDTEAMAVDAISGSVLLLPKFVEPLRVFRVALQPGNDELQVAQPWATLTEPGEASAHAAAPKFRPTGLALAANGRYAAVLGYRSAWLYQRRADEGWQSVFTHTPQRVAVVPPLHQPEAIGFSHDGGALFITGEGIDQPLLRMELPRR